jgi:hypothetical protein
VSEAVELSGDALIRKLRHIVRPPGKKGTWLRFLSDRQLAEVYQRLKQGQSIYSITRIAQSHCSSQRNSSIKSLSRAVRQFREAALGDLAPIPAGRGKQKDKKDAVKVLRQRGARIQKKLDGLGRLRWLIDKQTDRLEDLMSLEGPIPFKQTERTVKELGILIENYMKIQMELGLVETKPSELHLLMHHRFHGLLEHTVKDGGQKMIEASNRLLEMAEQEALTLVEREDGTFCLQDKDGKEREVDVSLDEPDGDESPSAGSQSEDSNSEDS